MSDLLTALEVTLSGVPLVAVSFKWLIDKIRENLKKKAEKELVALIVVEIGRSILDQVSLTFGEPGAVIRYVKTVEIKDFPKIAAEVYQALLLILKELKEEGLQEQPITLVLSGPVSLSFQIGQALGLLYDVQLVHWDRRKHDYEPVPAISRKMLDSHSFAGGEQIPHPPATTEPIVVVDIGGKGVFSAVQNHFGSRAVQGVTYSEIDMIQVPTIATEVFHKVVNLGHNCEEIGLVLSGPLVFNAQLGQALGFHYNIKLYQWQQGKYFEVPPLTREMLAGVTPDASSSPSSEPTSK